MLKPDQLLAVTLTAAEWNLVMRELGRNPFNRVAGVVLSIQTQCQNQQAAVESPPAQPFTPVARLHSVPDNPEDISA